MLLLTKPKKRQQHDEVLSYFIILFGLRLLSLKKLKQQNALDILNISSFTTEKDSCNLKETQYLHSCKR